MDSPAPVKSSHGDSHVRLCLHYVEEAKGERTLLISDEIKGFSHVFHEPG